MLDSAEGCVLYFMRNIEGFCALPNNKRLEKIKMERIKTIETKDLVKSCENGGCGECQTSCQSACKTSCGVANQQCENTQEN